LTEQILLSLTSIVVLGIGAQWIAWRFRLPAILLLLIFGFIAGPVTGFLNPDRLLGDLLVPAVSISVALILFEGSLGLNLSEWNKIGSVVRNLITVGALLTWIISAAACYLIVGLNPSISVLLGAVLVVTGPTVIIPLLRHVQPVGRVGPILKWEGILIDPVGAMLALLVFEAILASGFQAASTAALKGFLQTVLIGGAVGAIGAGLIVLVLRYHLVPDFLHNAVPFMIVVSVFTASNLLQHESGLLAVTLMGVALANQKKVTVKRIIEFKENLRVLLLAGLFILLAARLQLDELSKLNIRSFLFLAVLIILVRPLSVAVSTMNSGLSWRERFFLSAMAPRGVVAAAVSSAFALRLERAGYEQSDFLEPLTFLVIIGTVTIYGLTASALGRWLKLSNPNPQGILFVGAHPWAREMARAVQSEGYKVLLVDTNWANLSAARQKGLPTFYGSALSEYVVDELELEGINRLVAMTSNDEVNSLASLHFADLFSRANVFQLAPKGEGDGRNEAVSQHQRGRLLFGPGMTYNFLAEQFEAGGTIKTTRLTGEFDFNAFQSLYKDRAVPLFLITETGELMIFTTDKSLTPQAGQGLIFFVMPIDRKPSGAERGLLEAREVVR
jgi:NhaP-type Na+/H+ or K+/H+ antiporter